ncbi:hypothetical protein [Buttiauxella noackiae]|uniref:hypothetical protein n=1 Tax=Buttiauxella noackiae TaxID=82992 RepID=UPI002356F5D0|nr:hypothetical protein [Buttiauxella noackiae]MCA1920979.1 hypothetical protein [Buttiauxella noackiae]
MMNKAISSLFIAFIVLLIARPVVADTGNKAKTNHFCIGNSDHPERKVCDDSSQDDYYEQYPQTKEDFDRNERYMQTHQTYICRRVSPSYPEGVRVREYVVTDPRNCR